MNRQSKLPGLIPCANTFAVIRGLIYTKTSGHRIQSNMQRSLRPASCQVLQACKNYSELSYIRNFLAIDVPKMFLQRYWCSRCAEWTVGSKQREASKEKSVVGTKLIFHLVHVFLSCKSEELLIRVTAVIHLICQDI